MKFVPLFVSALLASGTFAFSAAYITDFESPPFFSGPINNQDGWTTPSAVEATARIRTASEIESELTNAGLTPGVTVHGGNQALLVSGLSGSSATIRTISGLETDKLIRLDVWARPLTPGTTGEALGNIFLTMEDAGGIRAAAFRFGYVSGVQTIDYGTNITGVWQPTGLLWNENTWYRLTLTVDYNSLTYDIAIDGVQVNSAPIPFYNPASADFRQIRIFRGNNQAGMIVDDLRIEPVPEPGAWTALIASSAAFVRRRRNS